MNAFGSIILAALLIMLFTFAVALFTLTLKSLSAKHGKEDYMGSPED